MIYFNGKELANSNGKLLKDYQMQQLQSYTLKCGETLYSVCNKFGLDVEKILLLNPTLNPTRNYEGVKIRIK